jgi:hypothetical protein
MTTTERRKIIEQQRQRWLRIQAAPVRMNEEAARRLLSCQAAAMGRIKSWAKANASRENGKKGGRPKKMK